MNETPSIGVVAIGRNEGERLRRCLESLHGRVEQIVYVDSGSTDGSVEALAFGAPEALDRFIAKCRQGPPAALVERIDVEDAEGDPPEDFGKAPTT